MNKKFFGVFTTLAVLACFFAVTKQVNAVSEVKAQESVSDLLNSNNWKNLPGYEYKNETVRTEAGTRLPAEVSWPADENDVGINFKMKGYYCSGTGDADGNMFAGLVYKNKILLKDLSVTFTINSLGANSAVGDDGWISICFLTKENLFSTTDPNLNMGAIALLRTQTRSITVYDHEIGQSKDGTKYANFSSGTPVSLDLDTYPACEGCTIRVRYEQEATAAAEKFYLVVEQLDFETQEVISSKRTANPLIHSDDYAAGDQLGYFVISSSTNNFEKQWDVSIKNINGTDIGLKSDVKPLTPEEKAELASGYINKLKISTYCNMDGTIKESGVNFYSPFNAEVDVNGLMTSLSSALYSFTDDDSQALYDISREAGAFKDAAAYKAYLDASCANIIKNYEDIEANTLIDNINATVALLPPLDQVSLSNEQEVSGYIAALQVYYEAMNDRITEIYGKENKEKLWNDIIVKYSDKLDDIKFEKFTQCVDALPAEVTQENLQTTVLNLVPAEMTYDYFEEKIDIVRETKPEMYNQLIEKKAIVDITRVQVESFKVTQRALVEDLETAARVNYDIYYLPESVTSDLDSVFAVLTQYASLSSSVRNYVESADKLFDACAKALDAAIVKLPSVENLTKENYIKEGYDIAINDCYGKYIQLKNVSPDYAKKVTQSSKLLKLVDKLDKLQHPLGANAMNDKTLDAKATLEIAFVDMFTNYSGRNYEITTSHGTVDMANEKVVIQIKENGTYTVTVTCKDKDYGETATCSFKVTVTGAGGCGGSITAASAIVSVISLLGIGVITLKKKRK